MSELKSFIVRYNGRLIRAYGEAEVNIVCDYCDGSMFSTKGKPKAGAVIFHDWVTNKFKIRLYEGDGKWIQQTINYCPMCGRKLEEQK